MSETELAIIEPTEFISLDPTNGAMQAYKENCEGEPFTQSDLIRIKTPSAGATKWTVPLDSGEEQWDEVEGILVYTARQGTLWASEESIGGDPPVLISRDMMTARNEFNVEIPDNLAEGIASAEIGEDELGKIYSWPKLPYTQWGSGKGKSKRAKDSRVLYILPRNAVLPFVLTAQPGSLKTINPFVRRLAVPFYRAVVLLGLQRVKSNDGIDYSQIVPRFVGDIGEEAGKLIKAQYTDPLKQHAETMVAEKEDG